MILEDIAERVTKLELHREYQTKALTTMADEMHAMNKRLADIEKKVWIAVGAIVMVQIFIVPIVQAYFVK